MTFALPGQEPIEGMELPDTIDASTAGKQRAMGTLGQKPGEPGFKELYDSDEVVDHDKVDRTSAYLEAARANGFLPETAAKPVHSEEKLSAEHNYSTWNNMCYQYFGCSLKTFAAAPQRYFDRIVVPDSSQTKIERQNTLRAANFLARVIKNNQELLASVPDSQILDDLIGLYKSED